MPQDILNQRSAGVVDPILSTHARGYRNREFIAHQLFPRVPIPNRSMRVLRFGKQSFRMLNTRRAPGAGKKTVQFGYASDPISLVQDTLEGKVPFEHQEEAASIPGIDMQQGAINMVLDVLDLGLEHETATIVRNAASYDANHKLALTGADRWSSPTSDPKGDIKAAREAIRRSIGRYPTTLMISATTYDALCDHPAITDRFKYTSSESITTNMLAAYFGLKQVIIGEGVYLPDTAADTDQASDIWGDDAILAYVPMEGNNYQVPSFGYTYELSGYPQVTTGYIDRTVDCWIYPTTVERRPILTGAEGGFLFQNAGGV